VSGRSRLPGVVQGLFVAGDLGGKSDVKLRMSATTYNGSVAITAARLWAAGHLNVRPGTGAIVPARL
jgi:hypothetical protein